MSGFILSIFPEILMNSAPLPRGGMMSPGFDSGRSQCKVSVLALLLNLLCDPGHMALSL